MKDETNIEAVKMSPPSARSEKVDIEESSRGEVDNHEVFKDSADGVKFRTLGWPMASIIFLKCESST